MTSTPHQKCSLWVSIPIFLVMTILFPLTMLVSVKADKSQILISPISGNLCFIFMIIVPKISHQVILPEKIPIIIIKDCGKVAAPPLITAKIPMKLRMVIEWSINSPLN